MKVLEAKDHDVQKGGTKLNKENFYALQMWMRIHIYGIGDVLLEFLDNAYVNITTFPLTAQQLKEK